MTEKRYYLENFKDFTVITLRLYDRKIKFKDYDWLTESHKIVDLLNDFAEENEQLKHDATVLIQANQDYRKENEKLKSENQNLRKCINEIYLISSRGSVE